MTHYYMNIGRNVKKLIFLVQFFQPEITFKIINVYLLVLSPRDLVVYSFTASVDVGKARN